ncbi:MAG: hypothetical protein ACHQF4_11495 [Sphingobacteriales bacterium]
MSFNKDAFFHEDNYCQIELLPIQNLLVKRNETDFAKDQLDKNFTEHGFVNITSRSQTTHPLTNLDIAVNQFTAILQEDSLFFLDKVYTGYSTHRSLRKNTHGFVFENYILYYEFNDNFITKSWIDYNLFSDTLNCYPKRLQMALFKLGGYFNLILIDWNELITIILKDEAALTDYINEIL